MNYSTDTSQSKNNTKNNNGYFNTNISYNQFIGIIIAGSALLISIGILLYLIIYQKYRLRKQKLTNHGLTSNNPCYVGSSMNQFDRNMGHAHCNMTVSTDFYDIDDLTSLDNDSFLNSLENAIFVGYLNHSRPSIAVDNILSQSTVHSNQTVNNKVLQVAPISDTITSRHSYKKSASSRYSSTHSSVKLRAGKTKHATNSVNNNPDSVRTRAKSETISESIGSTSNLITSSKMFLNDSNDSVCDSSRGSTQLADVLAARSRETNVDHKAESSTDSHTSVNSSSAMMSGYTVEKPAATQVLPDIISISLPRAPKPLKRACSSYSNNVHRDDSYVSSTGQILDPLRAGQNTHFINEISHSSMKKTKHERHFSYNVALANHGLSEYNVPS